MGRQILSFPTPVPGYLYTAFFALLLAPVCAMTLPNAMAVWGVIQFICLIFLWVISARGLLKLASVNTVLFAGICITSYPVLHNFKWGQVSVPITLCVIAAFYASTKEKPILAGILLAFATAIKFYPALFIVYFVLKRDMRVCLTFISGVIVFYIIIPASILGPSLWFAFEKAIHATIGSTDLISQSINSQYAMHVWLRWFSFIFDRPSGTAIAHGFSIIGYMIALFCIALVWLLQRKAFMNRCALSMVVLFLSLPFAIKTSWPHYFVYLPVCQAVVFFHLSFTSYKSVLRRIGFRSLPVLSMLLSSIFIFNGFSDWRVYNSYGMLFIANFLLLIAVTVIILGDYRHMIPGRKQH